MDILRKELNSVYASQQLGDEPLDTMVLECGKATLSAMVAVDNACYVITDASSDVCFIYAGSFAKLIGISDMPRYSGEFNSSDEDIIYNRIHPEDLVEKRMLEYDFFRYVDGLSGVEKLKYVASCRLRVKNAQGEYIYVNNTTRIMHPSPKGKIWLIMCSYELSSDQSETIDIVPRISNHHTGVVIELQLMERRTQILSAREKEILIMIHEGKSSKLIADELCISIHTVNRHRQNILEKLSVNNSHEAIKAAVAMKLM